MSLTIIGSGTSGSNLIYLIWFFLSAVKLWVPSYTVHGALVTHKLSVARPILPNSINKREIAPRGSENEYFLEYSGATCIDFFTPRGANK